MRSPEDRRHQLAEADADGDAERDPNRKEALNGTNEGAPLLFRFGIDSQACEEFIKTAFNLVANTPEYG